MIHSGLFRVPHLVGPSGWGARDQLQWVQFSRRARASCNQNNMKLSVHSALRLRKRFFNLHQFSTFCDNFHNLSQLSGLVQSSRVADNCWDRLRWLGDSFLRFLKNFHGIFCCLGLFVWRKKHKNLIQMGPFFSDLNHFFLALAIARSQNSKIEISSCPINI